MQKEMRLAARKYEQPAQNPSTDFRRLLQGTLIERCKRNPKYSLRAFAAALKVEPSFLSKILSGKRKVTEAFIKKAIPALGLSPLEVRPYLTPKTDSATVFEKLPFTDLSIDTFEVIADWHHYAILELVQTDGFKSDYRWMATRLGTNPAVIQSAVERLIRVEMLERTAKGALVNTAGNSSTVGNDFTAVAFRKLQKQVLIQALDALENVPLEKRDQSSMTMGIDPKLLPEAKIKIRDFRRGLCAWLQSEGNARKEVYQMSLSLFPITRTKN